MTDTNPSKRIAKMREELPRLIDQLPPKDGAFIRHFLGDDLDEPEFRTNACIWNVSLDERVYIRLNLYLPSLRNEPLHSHAYDFSSVILYGGYRERWRPSYRVAEGEIVREFRQGDMLFREADQGHHLTLLPEFPCCITLMTAGPSIRDVAWFEDEAEGGFRPERDRTKEDFVRRIEAQRRMRTWPAKKPVIELPKSDAPPTLAQIYGDWPFPLQG